MITIRKVQLEHKLDDCRRSIFGLAKMMSDMGVLATDGVKISYESNSEYEGKDKKVTFEKADGTGFSLQYVDSPKDLTIKTFAGERLPLDETTLDLLIDTSDFMIGMIEQATGIKSTIGVQPQTFKSETIEQGFSPLKLLR